MPDFSLARPTPMGVHSAVRSEFKMKSPVLFIIQNDSILTLAIISLLAADSEAHVIYSSCVDTAGLLDEISRSEPDVVLLDEQALGPSNEFLTQLLMENSGMRVIVIHQNSNRLEIYRKNDILITSAADLLEIVNQSD